jgi:hypothetical protein
MPVGSVGNTQFLDAIDQVLSGGQPVPGLADYLASAGVRYVLVENDLTPADTQSPPPVVLRQVLAQEPGLVSVARFGPVVHHVDPFFGGETRYDPTGVTRSIHALEVYRVVPATGHDDRVTTYPSSSGVVLSGGPQGLLAAANAGLLQGEAVSLAGDPLGPKFTRPVWVDADTQQRRDTQYTSLYENQSSLLAAGDTSPSSGGQPDQWIVVSGDRHETTLKLLGATQISASSFGPIFNEAPGQQPLDAFLDDAGQGGGAWEASPSDPRPWIAIRFDHSLPLSQIALTPLVGSFQNTFTKVQITTARGGVTDQVSQADRPQEVRTPEGTTRWLRVTLVGLRNPPGTAIGSGPGLAHIAIPGVTVTQRWIVPADGPTTPASPAYLFTSPLPNQFAYFRPADDEVHLSRQFSVSRTGMFAVSGAATPLESPLLASAQLSTGSVSASPAQLAAPFSVPCGSGPPISIDGRSYATSVHGTVGELYALHPMQLSLCAFDGAVQLSAGTHAVTAEDLASNFKVTSLQVVGTVPAVAPARRVSVKSWSTDTRTLTVAAGPASIINVHENYNSGWVATAQGHRLPAVRLDGWQQGWVLPAADSTEQVTLRFVPDSSFRAGLVVGAVIALALFAWVVTTGLRRPKNRDGARAAVSQQEGSNPIERTRPASTSRSPARLGLYIGLWTGVIMVLVFVVAGPVAVAVPLCLGLWLLARRRRAVLAWIAGCAEALAGLAIALHPGFQMGVLSGSGSYTAQVLGALALAALAISLLPSGDERARV